MRFLLCSIIVLGMLVGCSGKTVISDTPKYSPGDYGHRYRTPAIKPRQNSSFPAASRMEETFPPMRGWDISEDRFITTHSIDTSADALKLPPEEIKKRLNELDKK